jgi:hypothetical protein
VVDAETAAIDPHPVATQLNELPNAPIPIAPVQDESVFLISYDRTQPGHAVSVQYAARRSELSPDEFHHRVDSILAGLIAFLGRALVTPRILANARSVAVCV